MKVRLVTLEGRAVRRQKVRAGDQEGLRRGQKVDGSLIIKRLWKKEETPCFAKNQL